MDDEKSSNDSTLNEYFEAMSFTDDEEETWKRYTDVLLSRIEELAVRFRSRKEIPIDFCAFGSTAEKLRIFLPENVGDIDFMVFPIADETRISESIIEYSIPGTSVFVRLRGKDHPVLQHCLAENSNYVATATLKDFHPKVFGHAILFDLIPKVFQKYHDISSCTTAPRTSVVKKSSGPSIQCDFAQCYESLTGQFEQMKGISNVKFNENARGFFEWLAVNSNTRTFTKDHSAVVDEFLNVSEENIQKFNANPSVDSCEEMFKEALYGSKGQEFQKKIQELDRLAEQKTNEDVNVHEEDEEGVAGEMGVNMEEPSETGQSIETRELENSQVDSSVVETSKDDCIDVQESLKSVVHQHDTNPVIPERTDSDQPNSIDCKEQEVKPEDGAETEDEAEPEDEAELEDDAELEADDAAGEGSVPAVKDVPDGTGCMTSLITPDTKDTFLSYVIECILRMDDPSKSPEDIRHEYLQFAGDDQTRQQKGGLDIVPAFLATGWPSVANAWISRDRLWPNQGVISDILKYGYHLVVKTPKESERPDLDFRLSFSHAELALSKELNDVQRECYRCFKFYHLTLTQNIEPKTFATYFLKTILFWAVEETGMEFWSSENRGACVMMLLGKLLKALENKFLPHFFIPDFNLLEDALKDFPKEMEFLAVEAKKLYENPMSYPNVSLEEDHHTKATTSGESSEDLPTRGASATQFPLKTVYPRRQTANLASHDPCQEEHVPTVKQVSTVKQVPTVEQQSPFPENSTNQLVNSTNNTPANNTTGPWFLRYNDFQDLYREVSREMLDLALKDGSVDAEDPTVKSIVTNLREVMSKTDNPEREIEIVMETGLEMAYSTHVFHSGPDAKHRILSALKGQWEMFAYVARQDDLIATGNGQLIVNRMLNSSSDGSNDSFDLSALYPMGNGLLQHVVQVMDNQFEPVKQAKECDDDIPLD
jgi:hypothetical protein